MDAEKARVVSGLVNSKKISVVDQNEFNTIQNPKFISLIPDGSLFLCNNELFVFFSKKFKHLKFCGCETDKHPCFTTTASTAIDIPQTPRNKK